MKNSIIFQNRLLMLLFPLFLMACGSTKDVTYFQNKDVFNVSDSGSLYDARIMPKDVLTITVSTVNPVASMQFNLLTPTSQTTQQTYLVDNDGKINFPIIGEIKLAGMTKNEAERYITERISPYLVESENPIVTVRMSSFSISVLGEVNNPGTFMVSREKISILEALSRAGDMTIYGLHNNVTLIREDINGRKSYHTLNLNDANIVNSPYYYLQQNDVVYVEPNKVKASNSSVGNSTTAWLSSAGLIASLVTLMVTIFK